MTNPHGSFIWYELLTPDPDAAQRFYADVVGWTIAPFEGAAGADGAMDYRILSTPDGAVGGLAAPPPGAIEGAPAPGWYGYIGVDDVDAAVADIVAAGGTVCMPATDIPGVGRIAMVADPGGVPFYVMRGAGDGDSQAFSYTTSGHCSWNELLAADLPQALDFYTGCFGWTQGDSMSMGEMGDYRFLHDARDRIGAAMRNPPGWGPPHWNFYFRVEDIEAAAERVAASGGHVTQGPVEVPGGDRIVQGIDPQGLAFALVGGAAGEA